jgi:hypothetical protein
MNIITNLLFWISTGMLIPVVVLLLFLFGVSLVTAGGFFALYMRRLKEQARIKPLIETFKNKSAHKLTSEVIEKGDSLF